LIHDDDEIMITDDDATISSVALFSLQSSIDDEGEV
jgi:hypothetical protein